MGAWKQFLASDFIVNPFEVNKGFSYNTSSFYTQSNGEYVGIDRFLGKNIGWDIVYTDNETTGTNQVEYQSLVYKNIQHLYYSNFRSSSYGDNVSQPILIPGSDSSGDRYIGSYTNPNNDNFLQSTLTPTRFFPSGAEDIIGVISIPSKIFGEYIVPGSIILSSGSQTLIDDSEGNIIISGSNLNYGNVIYPHGIIILTNSASYTAGGGSEGRSLSSWITDDITISFSSSFTIYETQYKCTIRESEFNYTLNPSAQSGGSLVIISGSSFYQPSDGSLSDNVTGSYFTPYVTTVGLYDEMQNLLAVGKLSQPLQTSATTDTTILVNLDL